MPHIVFVAGGTGGHIFPALATAKALIEKEPDCQITLYTDRDGEDSSVKWQQFFLPRKNNRAVLPLFIFMLAYQYFTHLLKFIFNRPRLAVGFGGYACVPVMLAAQTLGIPTILHEQNAYIGKANRILGKWAKIIALTFEKTMALPDHRNTILTGNPVRFNKIETYEPQDNRLHLFIFGGSQGAHSFSHLVPDAINLLPQDVRTKITVTHQCRVEDIAATETRYKTLGIHAELSPFFHDMAKEYTKADIVIARSGASTVAELTVAGRTSILIPYPYATDNHQYFNAQAIGDACFLFRQKEIHAKKLATLLQKLAETPELRTEKSQALHTYSMADAADRLSDVVREYM